jgi:hypothetical protein
LFFCFLPYRLLLLLACLLACGWHRRSTVASSVLSCC